MDHDMVVRHKMTERYLLDELDPASRDEFEEHFFDCRECALDVQAGALFVEQSKVVLAEKREPAAAALPATVPAPAIPRWLTWFRPMVVAPVTIMLLAVIGYQNLVMYPQLQRTAKSPQVLPWASVNVGTYGSEGPVVTTHPGQGFLLFVRIPPENGYSRYTADLYDPGGKLEWTLTIPATSARDQWPVQVPGANREAGRYTLAVHGVTLTAESKEVGRASFELQIQK
ncbi:MAG TPA: zf-HC2 domain-containing protein [Terriglobales bacterium]|nr:zf-HC2 domain-containing protein [Terriglobales bacterium]